MTFLQYQWPNAMDLSMWTLLKLPSCFLKTCFKKKQNNETNINVVVSSVKFGHNLKFAFLALNFPVLVQQLKSLL